MLAVVALAGGCTATAEIGEAAAAAEVLARRPDGVFLFLGPSGVGKSSIKDAILAQGDVREIYTSTFLYPRLVLNDIETLLMEQNAKSVGR